MKVGDAPDMIVISKNTGRWYKRPDGITSLPEYLSRTHSNALVAAACEGLVNQAVGMADGADEGTYIEDRMRDAIPDDAQAALDAIKAEVRREALQEAADVARAIGGLPENTGSPTTDDNNSGYNLASNDAADTILALMEKDT